MLEISRSEWQFDEPTGDIYAYDSFICDNGGTAWDKYFEILGNSELALYYWSY